MKTAQELYPNFDYSESDYEPIINNIGNPAVIKQIGDYQGDYLILYDFSDDNYGFLTFGFGSCTVCDALQSCESTEEIQELMDNIYNSIVRFNSKHEVIYFLNNHDWQGDWYWDTVDKDEFINSCIKYLDGENE